MILLRGRPPGVLIGGACTVTLSSGGLESSEPDGLLGGRHLAAISETLYRRPVGGVPVSHLPS